MTDNCIQFADVANHGGALKSRRTTPARCWRTASGWTTHLLLHHLDRIMADNCIQLADVANHGDALKSRRTTPARR